MAVNNKQGKTQIPEEAIEGPAGINDAVEFAGYTLGICCNKEVEIPTKRNTKTKVEDGKGKEVYSSELGLGMIISAKPGGIKKDKGMDR